MTWRVHSGGADPGVDHWFQGHRREDVFRGQALDPWGGVFADRQCATVQQLHAVEIDRLVASGHFDAAVDVQGVSGEIEFFGAGHA